MILIDLLAFAERLMLQRDDVYCHVYKVLAFAVFMELKELTVFCFLKLGLTGKNGGKIGKVNSEEKTDKEQQLVVSSIDFVGLDFADKKRTRGLPPGLIPVSDPFPEGDVPEVEIILGDTTKFDDVTATEPAVAPPQEDNSDLYKPKVSSWGVFPRPNNISETFGGGRTIRPGDVLETAEDRAAKDARTRELVAAYKKKMGLNIDAKLKSECEKI